MSINGILLFFHYGTNTGYAIGRLETAFWEMALRLTGDIKKIHLGYTTLNKGLPEFLPNHFKNIVQFNSADPSPDRLDAIYTYIKEKKIDLAFGFDQPVSRPAYRMMRKAGVRFFVSYYGSPMSPINHGLKLILKRLEVFLRREKPDHFIFESQAMANTAINGRGINIRHISVIPTGVDTDKFKPNLVGFNYAYQTFNIPDNRRIVFYSGHMEKRKGVQVIIRSACEMINNRKKSNVHFLFLGNRNGEEKDYFSIYSGTKAEQHLTFGGYREDIDKILVSCYAGVIASTGWDSFPMSSLEMAASGLPVIGSRLQGIVEGMNDGRTGFLVEPGDYNGLADRIEQLLENPALQKKMGAAARDWVLQKFSRERQIASLTSTMQELFSRSQRLR